MAKVTSLGHVGLFVSDYDMMRDFYTRVLGFTVTDEAEERGMCFLSAHPEEIAIAHEADGASSIRHEEIEGP